MDEFDKACAKALEDWWWAEMKEWTGPYNNGRCDGYNISDVTAMLHAKYPEVEAVMLKAGAHKYLVLED